MEHWDNDKVVARLMRSFVEVDGCWVYTKNLNWKGYGTFKIDGKFYKAHRVSYYLFNGDLVEKLVVDHMCKNRACFNPQHLRQITNSENLIGKRKVYA